MDFCVPKLTSAPLETTFVRLMLRVVTRQARLSVNVTLAFLEMERHAKTLTNVKMTRALLMRRVSIREALSPVRVTKGTKETGLSVWMSTNV